MPCEEGMQKLIDSGIKFDLIITSPLETATID